MKILLLVASVLLLTLIPGPSHVQSNTADIVFKNGNVYTANDKASRAQAETETSDLPPPDVSRVIEAFC